MNTIGCFFEDSRTFESVPINQISQAVGVGIYGDEFLENELQNEARYGYVWGAKRFEGKVILLSWTVSTGPFEVPSCVGCGNESCVDCDLR